jgi:GNAT superfamily N-acetyltransferase
MMKIAIPAFTAATSGVRIRLAQPADIPALRELIASSVRELSRGFYTDAQAESGLKYVFGVDSQLIADGSYYVVEDDVGFAAAGGWSKRRTTHGGDQMKGADDPVLDPAVDAARIRAFFVAPRAARRGLGRRLYEECAAAAARAGFTRLELVATMPGVPLYQALGFELGEAYSEALPDGVDLPVVHMYKRLSTLRAPADPDALR